MNPSQTLEISHVLADARTRLAAGDRDGAAALIGPLVPRYPDVPDVLLLAAEIALQQHAPGRALEHLNALDWATTGASERTAREGMVQHHQRAAAMALRVQAYMTQGRMDAASLSARILTDMRPNSIESWRMRAMVAMARSDWPTAARAIDQWLHLAQPQTPEATEAWRLRLRLCEQTDDTAGRAEARRQLADAPGAAPADPDYAEAERLDEARLHHRQNRLADALVEYEQLLADHDEDTALASESAGLLVEAGDLERASDQLLAALGHGCGRDRRIKLMRQLAVVRMSQGRTAEAGRWWWRMIETERRGGGRGMSPTAIEAWAALGVCAVRQGRASLADRCERALAHADTEQVADARWRAWRWDYPAALLDGLGQPNAEAGGMLQTFLQEAEQTLADAVEQQPDYADRWHHLAVCRRELGDADGARQAWGSALRINGGYVDAAGAQVEQLIAAGRIDDAERVVETLAERRGTISAVTALRAALYATRERFSGAVARLLMFASNQISRDQLAQRVSDHLENAGLELQAARFRRTWLAAQRLTTARQAA